MICLDGMLKMSFPNCWVSWIQACLLRPNILFSLIDNRLSELDHMEVSAMVILCPPYLFILIFQNLISILNKAMDVNMILQRDSRLSLNCNHLMCADDLILVIKATRRVTWNCNLCLSIYARLTAQNPNFAKYSIYYPSWINKKPSNSIASILRFKVASFHFNYLGVLILLEE